LFYRDPTYWANKLVKTTDIALTLSGHTDGMQAGKRLKNSKWSPQTINMNIGQDYTLRANNTSMSILVWGGLVFQVGLVCGHKLPVLILKKSI
jgi:hypothetical protein